MRSSERETLERRIHDLCNRGDVVGAVEAVLAGYGKDLLHLLNSILRDPDSARDAFSALSEHLLKDLPAFRWESSLRTWLYRVARNVAYRLLASSRPRREQSLDEGALAQQVQRERSRTAPWLRTQVKERFRELRSQLAPHEQTLLMLRVDRRMSWVDVARAMAATDESLTPADLARRATVLRQQFQRIKARLRELALQEELLSQGSGDSSNHA